MKIEIQKRSRQLLVRRPTLKTWYYFTIIGDNGEPVAQSEQYTAKHNVTSVLMKYFPGFEVHDLTGE